jgi:hypothetical protein
MTRSLAAFALLAALSLPPGDQTLVTRKGESFTGKVTRNGDDWFVETLSGLRRFPSADVACVFERIQEAFAQADARFAEAKKLFEAAEKLDVRNAARNPKLLAAIDLAQGASNLYRLVEPHARPDEKAAISRQLQVIQQFLRLGRGAATSDLAGDAAPLRPALIPLADPVFEVEAAAAPARPWVLSEEFGPGLAAWARDLEDPDESKRLAAVRVLSHPPSAAHLPGLLRLLETEKDPAVVRAVAETLAFQDPGPLLKSLGGTRKEADHLRRTLLFSLARSAGDRASFDFVLDWFVESPPANHADRAQFASAFRQFHAWSVPQLRELLTRQRNPKLQAEILKQMGVVGDKAFAPLLIKAIPAYTRESVTAILKLGKPALPYVIEGARSDQQDTRKICNWLCRRITGVQGINLDHFEKWWAAHRKEVLDDEKAWREEQARKGFPVDAGDFAAYDAAIEKVFQ